MYEDTGPPVDPVSDADPLPEAFLTSDSVIWPPVQVPLIPVILTPVSMANLIAAALAFVILSIADCSFPPLDVSSGAGSDVDSFGGAVFEPVSAVSEDSEASSFGGAGASFSPPASSSVNDSKAEASSPSSIMTAIGCRQLAPPFLNSAGLLHCQQLHPWFQIP